MLLQFDESLYFAHDGYSPKGDDVLAYPSHNRRPSSVVSSETFNEFHPTITIITTLLSTRSASNQAIKLRSSHDPLCYDAVFVRLLLTTTTPLGTRPSEYDSCVLTT